MTDASPPRIRREPPRFRRVTVRRVEPLTPRMIRVTLQGSELDGLTVDQPAASVRLLLPSPGTNELAIPEWMGNEFLLPDGSRPVIRTFTPWRVDPDELELDVGIVVHGEGAASEWAAAVGPDDVAAVSGPGRGYQVDATAPAYLVAGDETAIPAIDQLLRTVPPDIPVTVVIEVATGDGRLALPDHSLATVTWLELPPGAAPGHMVVDAVAGADLVPGTRVWAAGEAAAMQRIRRHLFEERGYPRAQTSIRGYWKHGRRGGDVDERDFRV